MADGPAAAASTLPGAGDIRGLLDRVADAAPDAVAIRTLDGAETTFGAIRELARRAADAVPTGARRVAVGADNTVAAVGRLFGAWRAGASAVLVGALLPSAEAARRVAEAYCDAVLGLPAEIGALPAGTAPAGDDETLLVFTSGTTGRPKATVLGADGLRSSCRGIAAGSGLPPEGRLPRMPGRSPAPIVTPLAHLAGSLGILSSWYCGKPVLLVPKFDADTLVRLVRECSLSVLRLTPTMVYDLAYRPADVELPSLRSATVGTAPLADRTRDLFEARYRIPLLQTYGQTEFAGAIAFERYADWRAGGRRPGSVGRLAPGVEVAIRAADGTPAPPGTPGEIWARGGNAMRGYLGPDGRVRSRAAEDWLATGDLGTLDPDGFLFLVGRVRELIICGGFNVYPAVVEAALNRLPAVVDSAVAGAPDARLGEVPVAALVVHGEPPTPDEVRAALRDDLAPYELPRRMVVVEALPRTDGGKPDRPAVVRLVDGPAAAGG